jgi:hypothetical protein
MRQRSSKLRVERQRSLTLCIDFSIGSVFREAARNMVEELGASKAGARSE